jgi:hypothetical protein
MEDLFITFARQCRDCQGTKIAKTSPIPKQVLSTCIKCEGKGWQFSKFVRWEDKEAVDLEIMKSDFLQFESRLEELNNPISPFQ